MKKTIIYLLAALAVIGGIAFLKESNLVAQFVWDVSSEGSWLMPLVLVAAVLDSVHPCSFSILLITIAFLFGLQFSRKRILQIGGAYVAGIFASYLLIGLGILKTLHIFNTPHFMGKLGAALLIIFGVINLLNRFVPEFPIKLSLPSISHRWLSTLIEKASIPTALAVGLLVGVCQFPCMGGPYLMVIGLLKDQVTYMTGLGYLVLYNLILIIPLLVVLWLASGKEMVDRMEVWKRERMQSVRLWAGLAMILLGVLIFYL